MNSRDFNDSLRQSTETDFVTHPASSEIDTEDPVLKVKWLMCEVNQSVSSTVELINASVSLSVFCVFMTCSFRHTNIRFFFKFMLKQNHF
jgi:hypothetical protein